MNPCLHRRRFNRCERCEACLRCDESHSCRPEQPGRAAAPTPAQLLEAIAVEADIARLDGNVQERLGRIVLAMEQLASRLGVDVHVRARVRRCARAVLAGWPDGPAPDEAAAWESRASALAAIAWVVDAVVPRVAQWLPEDLVRDGRAWSDRIRVVGDEFRERAVLLALAGVPPDDARGVLKGRAPPRKPGTTLSFPLDIVKEPRSGLTRP